MFNGIVKYTGKVVSIKNQKKNCYIKIKSKLKFNKKDIGSSISCSGVCLTLSNFKNDISMYYLSSETLKKSNFIFCKIGNIINLEQSIIYGQRISGHLVQGHVDTTGLVKSIKSSGKSKIVSFQISKKFMSNIVYKGSISINGVSLTISKITNKCFQVTIIPQSLMLTNLIHIKKNVHLG